MADDEDGSGLRYVGLGAFLQGQEADLIRLTVADIGALIAPNVLPAEADHRRFWANAGAHHPTRRGQWLDAGYKAYLEPARGTVRFERMAEKPEPWTQAELRACVVAYRFLLDAQLAGRTEEKARLRRTVVAQSLPTRSEGSYEFRMQNISSVLTDLGEEIVKGYLPRRNIGAAKPVIVELINELWARESKPEAPTADEDELATRVLAARKKLKGKGGPPPKGSAGGAKTTGSVTRFPRNPQVIAYALEEADGVCEVCDAPAPFSRADGEPFLEVHHVRWLAHGGPDWGDNAVAACPNCHRRLHHAADREALRRAVVRKVARIADHPRKPVKVEGGPLE